jgi:TolB-like protein
VKTHPAAPAALARGLAFAVPVALPAAPAALARGIAFAVPVALLAALASPRAARADEPLSLSVFDLMADPTVSPAVADGLNDEVLKRTKKVPGFAVGERASMPLPDLLKTVGCTTASVGCMTEVAGTILTVRRLLVGEVRPAPGGVLLRLRLLDVDAGRYAKTVDLRGTPDVVRAGLDDALRWLLHVPPPPLLKVGGAPDGAEVYLDGVRMGYAPVTIGDGVPPGKRVVKVRAAGYVDFQQTVALAIGTTAVVEAAMTK